MRKIMCLIVLVGMLALSSTAIAQSYNHRVYTLQENQSIPNHREVSPELEMAIAGAAITFIGAIFIFIMFWLLPSIVCGVAAKRKGLNLFWFFMLSIICSPVIGFLSVIAMRPKECPGIKRVKITDKPVKIS